jgi:hypothetical protein
MLRRKGFLCLTSCTLFLDILNIFSSRQQEASGESGQNDGGLERGRGHSYFLQKRRERANAVGQNLAARGSARFAG